MPNTLFQYIFRSIDDNFIVKVCKIFSLRPIISSIGTYNYNLAKFLSKLIDPVISKEHCAKYSFSFCEEIQQVNSNDNFLVSYDVCSLFTSIPL